MDGIGQFDRAAVIVEKRAHFAVDGADDEDVAGVQGAVLHKNGGDRAAAAIDAGFENGAAGRRGWIGAKLAQIGDEQDHFEELIEIFLFARGDFDDDGIAAPFFRHQAAIGKLALDAFGLGFGLIDLVDGDNDGHVGGTRVVDGFERLRHQAVIGGNDQHDNIGDLGATSTHAREGFVAGRIDEDDAAAVNGNDGCADVLGDASGFAGGDFGLANGIEQAGLAVVDVTHDGDDRRPRQEIFLLLFLGNFLDDFFFEGDDVHDAAEGFGEAGCRAHVQSLIDGGKNAAVEELFQDFLGAHVQLFREVADGDAFGDGDVARRTRRLRDRLDARGAALGVRRGARERGAACVRPLRSASRAWDEREPQACVRKLACRAPPLAEARRASALGPPGRIGLCPGRGGGRRAAEDRQGERASFRDARRGNASGDGHQGRPHRDDAGCPTGAPERAAMPGAEPGPPGRGAPGAPGSAWTSGSAGCCSRTHGRPGNASWRSAWRSRAHRSRGCRPRRRSRAARSRAMVSAVARQQVVLARPEPGRERQAQQPDEPASAREQRVSEQRERPAGAAAGAP